MYFNYCNNLKPVLLQPPPLVQRLNDKSRMKVPSMSKFLIDHVPVPFFPEGNSISVITLNGLCPFESSWFLAQAHARGPHYFLLGTNDVDGFFPPSDRETSSIRPPGGDYRR